MADGTLAPFSTKVCAACGEMKPVEDFPPRRRHKPGDTQARCRPCHLMAQREAVARYKEKNRAEQGLPPARKRLKHPAGYRICTACGETKPATTEFFYRVSAANRKKNPDALAPTCKPCVVARTGEWHAANQEACRRKSCRYRERNLEKERARHRARLLALREADLEGFRATMRAVAKRRRETNPAYVLHQKTTCRVRESLLSAGIGKRRRPWEKLLGYTTAQLKRHLERQFTKGMSWSNFGRGGWHIDHIVPLSSFRFTSIDDPEFLAAWALTNLRPLWEPENLRKHAKRLHLL